MSKNRFLSRNRDKDDPTVDPAVSAARTEQCDHVDENNDGVCDLCGIEVEVDQQPSGDTTTDPADFTNNADIRPTERAAATAAQPGVLGAQTANANARTRRVKADKFFFAGKTYTTGDTVEMDDETAARHRRYLESR